MINEYYSNILKTILNENINENINILLYINNKFNIYDYFSHIIKKKNLNVYVIITNETIYNEFILNMEGEDCENNIHILNNDNDINIIFDKIILFHLYSYHYLENKLTIFNKILNNNTIIYIYCTLSNEKNRSINFKNNIRYYLKKYTKYYLGEVLFLTKTIDIIQTAEYTIKSLHNIKKNNYILYGDNIVYELVLYKK